MTTQTRREQNKNGRRRRRRKNTRKARSMRVKKFAGTTKGPCQHVDHLTIKSRGAQIVMLPRVVSHLQVREGGDRQTKLPTSALQNLPRAKMVVDRVDSGPSALCNATRILSATEGCLCLIMERLSTHMAQYAKEVHSNQIHFHEVLVTQTPHLFPQSTVTGLERFSLCRDAWASRSSSVSWQGGEVR